MLPRFLRHVSSIWCVYLHVYSSILAKISLSVYNKYSSSPTLTGLPPKEGKSTRSPALTEVGMTWPVVVLVMPGPDAITVAWFNFSWFFSGMYMPDAVLVAGLTLCTKTRSNKGFNDCADFKRDDYVLAPIQGKPRDCH